MIIPALRSPPTWPSEVSHTNEHGEVETWPAADTLVDLSLHATKKTGGGTRKILILTTDHDRTAGEIVYPMGKKRAQKNQFR